MISPLLEQNEKEKNTKKWKPCNGESSSLRKCYRFHHPISGPSTLDYMLWYLELLQPQNTVCVCEHDQKHASVPVSNWISRKLHEAKRKKNPDNTVLSKGLTRSIQINQINSALCLVAEYLACVSKRVLCVSPQGGETRQKMQEPR